MPYESLRIEAMEKRRAKIKKHRMVFCLQKRMPRQIAISFFNLAAKIMHDGKEARAQKGSAH
jgi:hypothetical protein